MWDQPGCSSLCRNPSPEGPMHQHAHPRWQHSSNGRRRHAFGMYLASLSQRYMHSGCSWKNSIYTTLKKPPQAPPAMYHPQPVYKSWLGDAQFQWNHRQRGNTRFHTVWMWFPPHSSCSMWIQPRPSSGIYVQARWYGSLSPTQPMLVPSRSLLLRSPISIQWKLCHNLHWSGAANRMSWLTQVVLWLLIDADVHGQCHHQHVAYGHAVWRQNQDTEDRSGPAAHPGYPFPYIIIYGWRHHGSAMWSQETVPILWWPHLNPQVFITILLKQGN